MKPKTFRFRTPMPYHWATAVTLWWPRPNMRPMYNTRPAYCWDVCYYFDYYWCYFHHQNYLKTKTNVLTRFFPFLKFFEAFPLRFKTEKNPSVGRMEIYTNNSWEKLCTSQWDEGDLKSTCMAMGYYNNGLYVNDTWYAKRGNVSKTSIYHNCTIPTTCEKNLAKKKQFCKGKSELYSFSVFCATITSSTLTER